MLFFIMFIEGKNSLCGSCSNWLSQYKTNQPINHRKEGRSTFFTQLTNDTKLKEKIFWQILDPTEYMLENTHTPYLEKATQMV